MQACPGKERQSSNYSKNVGRLWKETKTASKKREKLSRECHEDLG